MELLALFFAAFTLTVNTSFYMLYVDTLLPLAGIALVCLLFADESLHGRPGDRRVCIAAMIPMNLFLTNIKNSGWFFAAIGWLVFALVYRKRIGKKEALLYLLGNVLLPVCMFCLWKLHLSADIGENSSKFRISVDFLTSTVSGKTPEDLLGILNAMTSALAAFKYPALLLQPAVVALAAGLCFVFNRSFRRACMCLFFLPAVMLAYFISLFLTYVFAFPLWEAETAAAFDRYFKTVLLLVYGCELLFLLREGQTKGVAYRALHAFITLCCIVAMATTQDRFLTQIQRPDTDFETSDRYKMEENSLPPGQSYAVYRASWDTIHMQYYIAKYELLSGDLRMVGAADFEDSAAYLSDYDYVILWTEPVSPEDDAILAWMAENGYTGTAFAEVR